MVEEVETDWESIAREQTARYLTEEAESYRASVRDFADDLEAGETVTVWWLALLWKQTIEQQSRLLSALMPLAENRDPDFETLPDHVWSLDAKLHQALWQAVAIDEEVDHNLLELIVEEFVEVLLAVQSGNAPCNGEEGQNSFCKQKSIAERVKTEVLYHE